MFKLTRLQIYLAAIVGSLAVHSAGVGVLSLQDHLPTKSKTPIKVAVKVTEKPKPKPPEPPEPKKPEPPKPKPEPKKPKPKKPPRPKKPKSKKKSKKKTTLKGSKTPQKAKRIVQGLNPASVSDKGSGIAVPVGNTMLKADEGIRLRPEEVEALSEDLSQDASITCKNTPPYTEAAEEEGLEGNYQFDVYVDAKGRATEAEPRRKIGYGMDKVVTKMLLSECRYKPKYNAKGHAVATWATFTIRLTLDN